MKNDDHAAGGGGVGGGGDAGAGGGAGGGGTREDIDAQLKLAADEAVKAAAEAADEDADKPAYLHGLTPRQERGIIALLGEPSIAQSAHKIGIGERTLHRWLEEDRFVKAYRTARRMAFAHAIAMTQRYTPMAVQALARIMTDAANTASARVSAATSLLNFARESIELDDLSERVRQLEETAQTVQRLSA